MNTERKTHISKKSYTSLKEGPTTRPDCDFVLVHMTDADKQVIETCENTIKRQGLVLEHCSKEKLCFTKVSASSSVLKMNCEIMRLRMPVKTKIRNKMAKNLNVETNGCIGKLLQMFGWIIYAIGFQNKYFTTKLYKMTEEYSRSTSFLFDDSDPNFFSLSVRSMIVNFILEKTTFNISNKKYTGISELLEKEIYLAAYPPHDGTLDDGKSYRGRLAEKWASWKSLLKHQPLDEIKDYLGMKKALYFAWLGFYTHQLLFPSILSFLFLMYGVYTWNSDLIGDEVCNTNRTIVMCPLCDNSCDYWELKEACWYYRFRYLVVNQATPLYAFLMSIWSVLYVKYWRRYSAELKHRWGYKSTTLYPEVIRNKASDCFPWCPNQKSVVKFMRLPCFCLSGVIIIFLISIAAGFVLLSILYAMLLRAKQLIHDEVWIEYQNSLWIPATSAILYYVVITIANYVYDIIAKKITEWEFHRTQTEFDNSLYMKLYLFQFVSYYLIFFYTAFFKGKFIGHPGAYKRIAGLRQEECEAGGCLMEICIQIIIFMAAEQIRDNVMEYVWPCWNKLWASSKSRNVFKVFEVLRRMIEKQQEEPNRPVDDFNLNEWSSTTIFDEYLEMVLQFGYISIFIVACPVAPILALFNNFFIELRLDAKKFMKFYRRPIGERLPKTDNWVFILTCVGRLSVLSSAWMLADSTDIIQMWVYMGNVDSSGEGFFNYTLAWFNINDFDNGSYPSKSIYNVTHCRFFGYREPFNATDKYEKTIHYWHVLVAKLIFTLLYIVIVEIVVVLIDWFVSNKPASLQRQIGEEEIYITNEIIDHFKKTNEQSHSKEFRQSRL